jgi:hypothetical protein
MKLWRQEQKGGGGRTNGGILVRTCNAYHLLLAQTSNHIDFELLTLHIDNAIYNLTMKYNVAQELAFWDCAHINPTTETHLGHIL